MSCEKKDIIYVNNKKLNEYYTSLCLEYEKNNIVIEKITDFTKYAPSTFPYNTLPFRLRRPVVNK
jgi:hypothetical protein